MYQLYHYPLSQHARRVVSLLEEAGLDYELISVRMHEGEHMSESYLAVNPNHKVPTLLDAEIKIHESNAILRYLCSKHSLESWYPSNLPTRALVEEWLDWNQCRLGPVVVDIVLNQVFLADKGDTRAIAKGKEVLPELMSILEDALKSRPFIAGDRPTIADLSLASNVFHLGLADLKPDAPAISAWYDSISALKGFRASLPASP